jgi:RHS repeat-associated protein
MWWDFLDQLQATSQQVFTSGTPETTYYVYDAAGQRVRKVTERQAAAGQTPARKEERIYLSAFEIYRKYENDSTTADLERETLHIMDDQKRVALVETRTLDTSGGDRAPRQLIRYQMGNHLGSVSQELDHEAQIISYEEYSPYGSSTYQAVRNQTEAAKRYRYTGKERDEESGFTYHISRYYAPWIGRWVRGDPAGIAGGLNLYSYVLNNPLRLLDYFGMQPQATDISEPEPIYVRELEETIEINDVKPSDPDPRQAALTWAAGQGYIDLHSLTEHERQLRFSYERNARDYSWTRGPADEWYAQEYPEEAHAEAETKWQNYVNRDYAELRERKAEEWAKSTRLMATSGKVGKAIGWVTVLTAGAFAVGTAIPAGSVTGGGLGLGPPAAAFERNAVARIAKATLAAIRPNTILHIFGKAAHKLAPIVAQLGSEGKVMEAVAWGLARLPAGTLPAAGLFQAVVRVGSQNVTVRGAVVNGIVRISTMFIP